MNKDRLRLLMREHRLSYKAVARMLGISVATVHAKLKPSSSRSHRRVMDRDLRLIAYELASRKSKQ